MGDGALVSLRPFQPVNEATLAKAISLPSRVILFDRRSVINDALRITKLVQRREDSIGRSV